MNRWFALLICLLLFAGLPALAEGEDMVVVNCESWVSLRAQPSTSARRLAKVPLGDIVRNCTWVSDSFIYCEFDGWEGYVLAKYLEPMGVTVESGDFILEQTVNNHTVRAMSTFIKGGELLSVDCWDGLGNHVWNYERFVPYCTELEGTAAFFGGTLNQPLILVYDVESGLHALDFFTGRELWVVPRETVNLGASISYAVGWDGTMYIGGYYGPDPVAIDVDGNVRWQGVPGVEVYWMYEIGIENGDVVATYDCLYTHENPGQICYSAEDGLVLWHKTIG